MAARLVLVLGILFATPALAAKPFPIAWQITPGPILLSGGVDGSGDEVPIGPFEGSGSWQLEGVGAGSVGVGLNDGAIVVTNSGSMGSETRMWVGVALEGEAGFGPELALRCRRCGGCGDGCTRPPLWAPPPRSC